MPNWAHWGIRGALVRPTVGLRLCQGPRPAISSSRFPLFSLIPRNAWHAGIACRCCTQQGRPPIAAIDLLPYQSESARLPAGPGYINCKRRGMRFHRLLHPPFPAISPPALRRHRRTAPEALLCLNCFSSWRVDSLPCLHRLLETTPVQAVSLVLDHSTSVLLRPTSRCRLEISTEFMCSPRSQ
jgi:hypothetical protein